MEETLLKEILKSAFNNTCNHQGRDMSKVEVQNNTPTNWEQRPLSRQELKSQRVDELLDSCRDEILKQIISPFGLTPAMFNDKDGGNVTTIHNFENGVVSSESDAIRYSEYHKNIESPLDRHPYDVDFPQKRKTIFKSEESIVSAYTGKELPRDGQTHLDHVTPVAAIERNSKANLMMSKSQRVDMANAQENLVPCESSINMSMSDKDKTEWANTKRKGGEKTNAEHYGINNDKLNKTVDASNQHINTQLLKAQITKQGSEILKTGAEEAVKNALKQATGMLLFEVVNGSYVEIKRIAKEPALQENFVDHLINALRNVMDRVKGKIEELFESLISGGAQGFVSNLLTFIINSVVTTSAKVVTVIREGMKGLWEALKLVVSPPPNMPGMEVARQATKLIAAVVTTSLGIVFEESIKGFILSIPILAPLAGIISPAITAILTGIVTSLVVFGIDNIFDWLSSDGTEMLSAQIENMEASRTLFEQMAQMLQSQFNNSNQYQLCIEQYAEIQAELINSSHYMINTVTSSNRSISLREAMLTATKSGLSDANDSESEIENLLLKYEQLKGKSDNV